MNLLQNPNFDLIRQWATDRNLIEGATPQAQFVKLVEEYAEFTVGMTKDDMAEIEDGLGDSVVVLTILAAQMGTSIEECFNTAIEEKDVFVIIEGEDMVSAMVRNTINEIGRIATGVAKKNKPMVMLGIGRVYGLLQCSAELYETDIDKCIQDAYDTIKDRKGRMVDGVFIKEADFHLYGIDA
jgi:NTP pyrophosphatase (non-canonical NTP hydrolase)